MSTHICFGVGSSRGSIQPFALEELSRHMRVTDVASVHGNSVGAITAAMEATGQRQRLMDIWRTIEDRDVYRRAFSVTGAALSALRNRAMLDTSPLYDLLIKHLRDKPVAKDFYVQTTTYAGQLRTHRFPAGGRITEYGIRKIYESCAIPFVFPDEDEADGGIINPTPLDSAIAVASPGDLIIIISPHPVRPYAHGATPGHVTGKVMRGVEIMQAALVRHSVERFMEINDFCRQQGVDEWVNPRTGKRRVRFDAIVVAPGEPLPWGMMDFKVAGRLGEAYGTALARRALELRNLAP